MAFARPTLAQLVDRIEADFVSRLNADGSFLRRAMIYVLARVIAGAVYMLHGHLDYLSRQFLPDTADDEFLVRIAALYGLTRNAPGFAHGTLTCTGTNTTVIPAGSTLSRSDGAEYTTDADATISSGTATVAVTAVVAGAAATLAAGQSLAFESPISGVDSSGTVAASTVDGTDQETIEELRARVEAHLSDPPHGGTLADYVAWAKEIAGVTRVWPVAEGLGPGTVLVRFVRDDDVGSIIPSAGEVTAVQDHLDDVAPAHAVVTVAAPTAAVFSPTLHIVPDTSAVRSAVTAELTDLLLREAEPGGTILLSTIRTAIGNAAGLTDYTLTAPSADVTVSAGQLAVMGTVTFT